MISEEKIKEELERAKEVLTLLAKESDKLSSALETARNSGVGNAQEEVRVARLIGRFASDLLRIETEIAVLRYVLGESDIMTLPSQSYEIKDDGNETDI